VSEGEAENERRQARSAEPRREERNLLLSSYRRWFRRFRSGETGRKCETNFVRFRQVSVWFRRSCQPHPFTVVSDQDG
jgi:hypothetical protein